MLGLGVDLPSLQVNIVIVSLNVERHQASQPQVGYAWFLLNDMEFSYRARCRHSCANSLQVIVEKSIVYTHAPSNYNNLKTINVGPRGSEVRSLPWAESPVARVEIVEGPVESVLLLRGAMCSLHCPAMEVVAVPPGSAADWQLTMIDIRMDKVCVIPALYMSMAESRWGTVPLAIYWEIRL